MSSKFEQGLDNDNSYISTSPNSVSRTSKNAKLYRQIYDKYEDLDNLPVEDNTNEIDFEKLKELISNSNREETHRELREHLDILDTRKRKIDEQKIYDINKILEKAKNDNSKLNKTSVRESIVNKNILSTLESREISLAEIKEASLKYEQAKEKLENSEYLNQQEKEEISKPNDLEMTREFKFKELSE